MTTSDPDEGPRGAGGSGDRLHDAGEQALEDASVDYARPETDSGPRTFDEDEDGGAESGEDETILIDGRTLRGPPNPTAPATVGPGPVHHASATPTDSGLRALRRAVRTPRARGPQLLIGLLCGLLGFFAVVQVRVAAGDNNLRNARQSDLIRILDDLNDRSDRLEREIRELATRRTELQSGTDAGEAALQEAMERRATLGILAGTVPARGPGITLRITDPSRKVDAPVLLDTLQELRDAGAEAVQINAVRVVASTAFLDVEPGSVRIDGAVVAAPYVFKVIGDPDTLDPALRIPGGVFAVLNERGATATVAATNPVLIEATVAGAAPQYTRPTQPQP